MAALLLWAELLWIALLWMALMMFPRWDSTLVSRIWFLWSGFKDL